MTAKQPKRLVVTGTFVHSRSRQELEFMHNTVVCVDGNGKIVAIENASDGNRLEEMALAVIDKLGWDSKDDDIVWHTCEPGQFFFPGFIGML